MSHPTTPTPATTPAATPQLSRARRWAMLMALSAGLFLVGLDNSIMFTALPQLTAQLHLSTVSALWAINAYSLVMAGLLIGAGTLGDIIGHRRMFLIGLALFGCASLAAAFATGPATLIAARAALAVGAAAMMPSTLAVLRSIFTDEQERNFAIAVWGSVSIVSSGLGPIIGGFLIGHFWVGSIFLVNVPVCVIAIIATLVLLPAAETTGTGRWDWLSSVWAMFMMAGMVMAVKTFAHPPIDVTVLLASLAVAGGAGWVFIHRQRTAAEPAVDLALLKQPLLLAGLLTPIMGLFAIGGLSLATTQFFQLIEGRSALNTGVLVSVGTIAAIPGSLLAGAKVHRLGVRLTMLIGLGLIIVSLGGIAASIIFLSGSAGVAGFMISFAGSGFGCGYAMAVTTVAVLASVPANRTGMASSLEECAYELGNLLAVAIIGSALPAFFHAAGGGDYGDLHAPPPHAGSAVREGWYVAQPIYDAFTDAYLGITALAAAGLAVTWLMLYRLLRNVAPLDPEQLAHAHE
ncbi:MFS transporter [Corynebacterium sp. 13CS0277]|uniref:MFS transporter n=1 Tax=Corynebacterium sp. 13CS0277 TaxID=2071994 RepID=UPI000D424F41|nr:MFS transporter [Corynebacterium sp. 13CS0277]PRQ10746.1 MFS transporter [Corynebacterium sp. 13CS0277]